jgi:hypothetical protein
VSVGAGGARFHLLHNPSYHRTTYDGELTQASGSTAFTLNITIDGTVSKKAVRTATVIGGDVFFDLQLEEGKYYQMSLSHLNDATQRLDWRHFGQLLGPSLTTLYAQELPYDIAEEVRNVALASDEESFVLSLRIELWPDEDINPTATRPQLVPNADAPALAFVYQIAQ